MLTQFSVSLAACSVVGSSTSRLQRRFLPGTARYLIVCLVAAYLLPLSETNLLVEIVGSDFR